VSLQTPPPLAVPRTPPVTVESSIAATQVRLFVQNDCHEAVDVNYALKTPSFERNASSVLNILPGERKALKIGSYSDFDRRTQVFYTASSLKFTWQADQERTIDKSTRHYQEAVFVEISNKNRLLKLTCSSQ